MQFIFNISNFYFIENKFFITKFDFTKLRGLKINFVCYK